ncbi:MAG: ATP-binding protein [Phycisphaeraceae bacterium]|nr:ATP-binding protein [Phycisphaeraceae bacterium]
MLTRLYCDNYKCLVNFEFRPGPTQLLMGHNGAGKSTVFEVLALIRDFAARGETCEDRLVGQTRTRWQDLPDQRFELDVKGKSGVFTYELVVDESGRPLRPRVKRERLSLSGKPLYLFEDGVVHLHNDRFEDRTQFEFFPKRSFLAEIEARHDNKKLMEFKSWLEKVLCVQVDPKRMQSEAAKEAIYPLPDLSNFAEWYRHLRQDSSAATDELRASLQGVIGGFEGLDLKGPPSGTRVLQVALRTGSEGKSQQYGFAELSDGQRALVGLYTLLHCALTDNATLCIDEPDNFVALAEIQPWLLRLTDRGTDTNSQVMLASHHPELLNQLASRNGVIIERMDAGPTRVRSFAPPADTTLTPAEIVARGWEHA